MHKVAADLLPLLVPIDSIHLDPANARLHGDRSLHGIAASLRRYGQLQPIVVRAQTRVVEAGNGTLQAALMEGWTHVAALLVDDDPQSACGFAIVDNRAGELATWNLQQLLAQVDELQKLDVDLDITLLGFDQAELDALLQSARTPDETRYDLLVRVRDEAQETAVVAELTDRGYEARPFHE
jgi:ParB-like chromosome segregation protein Spo0J